MRWPAKLHLNLNRDFWLSEKRLKFDPKTIRGENLSKSTLQKQRQQQQKALFRLHYVFKYNMKTSHKICNKQFNFTKSRDLWPVVSKNDH